MPVIFDIAYTPYRLKKGSSQKDIEKHAKERAFFDMSGMENIYNYMTREGKIYGEQSKRLTILEYLQKSTGVFNQDGMLSKDEVNDMKFRIKNGEKNIWHGFISFDEQNSNKIDSPDRCIALIKQTFRPFFIDAGFDTDNMDLMCSLHLDRPTHLHIHYCFWEKEPKVKNQRAAGYVYRKKGKIKFEAIANMTERLNDFALNDELIKKRYEVERAIWNRQDFSKAHRNDLAMRALRKLEKQLPEDISWNYGSKDMKPYRSQIDDVVEAILFTDDKLYAKDYEFRQELERKKTALKDIMGKFYKEKLKKDMVFTEYMTDAADLAGINCGNILRIIEYKEKMNQDKLIEVLNFITNVQCTDEQKRLMLEMAANTITVDKLSTLVKSDDNEADKTNEVEIFKFTKTEILKMPKQFRKEFRTAGCTAHVLKRKSGKNNWNYMIRYRKNGYNVVASSNNLEEAKRKFIEKLYTADQTQKQQALQAIAPPMEINGIPATFDGFANYYFETFYKRKVCNESYRIAQSNYRNHVLPHFGNVLLSSITANKCQELIDRLVDEDKKRTSENIATLLNMLFTAAVKHAVLQHNPMDMVFHTKHQREHGKALSKDEERKLLQATAGTPYQLMFAVGLYTGMRPNEYKTATIEGEFIVANNSKRKNGKVELKRIPINPMLKPYLENVSDLSFVRLEAIRMKLKEILPNHKLYDLRTTFYTRCTECGVAEVAIKKFLGHTLGGLADTYTDLSDAFLLKESAKLNYA